MILDEKLFEESGVWKSIVCVCDYCGNNFERSKRNIKVGRSIINKESCNQKECVKQKRKESQLVKYGVENAGGTQESIAKAKSTWLKTLGVDNPSKSKKIRKKIEKTCKEKYGKSSYLATDECRKSLKDTSLEKYGVENPSQSEEIKDKIRHTCIEKYGVDHPRKYQFYMDEFCKSFLETHGVSFPSQMNDHLEKRKKTCIQKYGVEHPSKNIDIQEKIRQTCIERYGKYPVNCFGKTEAKIKEYINSLGFQYRSDRKILNGQEIDIFIPEANVAIEYCGLFWHNEMSPAPRLQTYHYNKFKFLLDNNIRLITIFEDEWLLKEDICKSVISSILGKFDNRIYARKSSVKKISSKEARLFLDNHHLQGSTNFGVAYGLYHNADLVACSTYGKHHRNKSDVVVLSRFCCAKNTQIVGGFSKLFKHATNEISGKIISWSDNRWSQGNVYYKLGFKLEEELKPDYSYYKYGSLAERVTKQSMRKSNTNCPKNMTEKEWCLQNNYVRIWDCGKKRWVFEN